MLELLDVPRDGLVFGYDEPLVADDGGRVELRSWIEGGPLGRRHSFTEEVVLPDVPDPRPVDDDFVAVARLLSLAAGLSYYKAFVPPTIDATFADEHEQAFLAQVVLGGLGEFAYRNDVPAALRPSLRPGTGKAPAPTGREPDLSRMLVAVGGGKDSIVSLEALRRLPGSEGRIALFSVNSYAPITRTAEVAGLPLLVARRSLDPGLRALNEAGALNGHVPVTAINSLISTLVALRSGFGRVVFSNERSSSYGNLHWAGTEINHQWSKGIGFERLLRSHLEGVPVDYVSFLRPLSELSIMRRFADHTAYHRAFTSCNRAFHLDPALRSEWCGQCDKCRFVFLMLAPFTGRDELLTIFGGRDLLADESQREGFLDLLGTGAGHKPFECVGEPDESQVAVELLRRHPHWRDHAFLQARGVADIVVPDAQVDAVFSFSGDHCLDAELERAARAVL